MAPLQLKNRSTRADDETIDRDVVLERGVSLKLYFREKFINKIQEYSLSTKATFGWVDYQ